MVSQSDMAEGIMKAIGIKMELEEAREQIAKLQLALHAQRLPNDIPEIDRMVWHEATGGRRTLIIGALGDKIAAKVLDQNDVMLVEMWTTRRFK